MTRLEMIDGNSARSFFLVLFRFRLFVSFHSVIRKQCFYLCVAYYDYRGKHERAVFFIRLLSEPYIYIYIYIYPRHARKITEYRMIRTFLENVPPRADIIFVLNIFVGFRIKIFRQNSLTLPLYAYSHLH